MKKRFVAMFLLLAVLAVPAAMAAPAFDESLFSRAKDAVILISYGEYSGAVEKIASADVFDAAELESYVDGKARSIYNDTIQKTYSVAWYDGAKWIVAVPFTTPNDDAVGCFAFAAEDGVNVTAYRYMTWGSVVQGYANADEVLWQDEYTGETVIAFADDGM